MHAVYSGKNTYFQNQNCSDNGTPLGAIQWRQFWILNSCVYSHLVLAIISNIAGLVEYLKSILCLLTE